MTTQHIQNTRGNLAVVLGNADPSAVEIFFRDNRLLQSLIRRHAGDRLPEDVYEQIRSEVCLQLIQAKPGSYDPSYAPSTYLVNIVREARRVVLAEQPLIYRPRSAPKETRFGFDEYIDEMDEHDGAPNIGTRSSDVENRIDAERVLAAAPDPLRDLLLEIHWNGASFKEACDEIGIERTRAYRALEAFKQKMN